MVTLRAISILGGQKETQGWYVALFDCDSVMKVEFRRLWHDVSQAQIIWNSCSYLCYILS
jgi:hypothetical protein